MNHPENIDDFQAMVSDFLTDHRGEEDYDELILDKIEQTDDGTYNQYCHDDKCTYVLYERDGSIYFAYIGTF